MSFTEYLDWLVENSDLFSQEIESASENHSENVDQLKF
jgi:hypothetical protein